MSEDVKDALVELDRRLTSHRRALRRRVDVRVQKWALSFGIINIGALVAGFAYLFFFLPSQATRAITDRMNVDPLLIKFGEAQAASRSLSESQADLTHLQSELTRQLDAIRANVTALENDKTNQVGILARALDDHPDVKQFLSSAKLLGVTSKDFWIVIGAGNPGGFDIVRAFKGPARTEDVNIALPAGARPLHAWYVPVEHIEELRKFKMVRPEVVGEKLQLTLADAGESNDSYLRIRVFVAYETSPPATTQAANTGLASTTTRGVR